MIKLIIIIAYALFVACATVYRPEFFAKNGFIDLLVSHEVLALLGVILTITFASVANIHLALNQVIARVYRKDIQKGQAKAQAVRDDINSNAWLMFWAFIICIGLLILKGEMASNVFWRSALNGLVLGTVLVTVLVMYDIHRTVFLLAASNLAVRGASSEPDKGKD